MNIQQHQRLLLELDTHSLRFRGCRLERGSDPPDLSDLRTADKYAPGVAKRALALGSEARQ